MTETYISEYRNCRQKYINLSDEISRIIRNSFLDYNIRTHSIEKRAKSIESFKKKSKRKNEDGTARYLTPLMQITDLAGVRIIAYTIDDIVKITRFIESNFEILEMRDVGEERIRKGEFGYQSIHYLIKLTEERLSLPEFSAFRELICEIQVRTLLQHAWAEMEHDIQYKGRRNVPTSMKRKFLSLAGMLEIADREFASIQLEDQKLKRDVLTDLQRDLTLGEIERSRGSANNEVPASKSQGEIATGVQVRSLLTSGNIKEAIELYDRKIGIEPTSYTLFIGRARAFFLLGDTERALKDIDEAEALQPDNPGIKSLRSKIADGSLSVPHERETNNADSKVKSGDNALREGRPEAAYRLYLDAQSAGASWPFTTFKLALASVAAGDLSGAELHLNELEIHPGTPMEINIVALQAVIHALKESNDLEHYVEQLQLLVDAKGDFNLDYSPLALLASLDGPRFWNDKANDVNRILNTLN